MWLLRHVIDSKFGLINTHLIYIYFKGNLFKMLFVLLLDLPGPAEE